jgi:hypothetical protein
MQAYSGHHQPLLWPNKNALYTQGCYKAHSNPASTAVSCNSYSLWYACSASSYSLSIEATQRSTATHRRTTGQSPSVRSPRCRCRGSRCVPPAAATRAIIAMFNSSLSSNDSTQAIPGTPLDKTHGNAVMVHTTWATTTATACVNTNPPFN